VTSPHRRDFLLDSSGVSALAASRDLLVAYLELLEQRFDAPDPRAGSHRGTFRSPGPRHAR